VQATDRLNLNTGRLNFVPRPTRGLGPQRDWDRLLGGRDRPIAR